ncbi:AtpZ/AtpI family protein [Wenxinia saemankumensis]|uniref:ATP synthase protein I n=1 Tax=Wenxinia saemankumensis TaxID=1447782 RepID=A0A1M6GTP9_9RHOB|nr:AtpZ/AtpI family protein [Wenxinia saemankumensis]SHJ13345.1 ATP synthase protein I [Wenxinia saemankumensis]
MTEPRQPTDQDRLRDLEARIAAAKKVTEPKPHSEEHYSRAQTAWRMVIELVAGLSIGFGIGYGLDTLLGTMPIFLVLFILLGFAAGVNVMLRTAREITDQSAGPRPPEREDG